MTTITHSQYFIFNFSPYYFAHAWLVSCQCYRTHLFDTCNTHATLTPSLLCFCTFFRSTSTCNDVWQTFFPLSWFIWGVLNKTLNQPPEDEHFWHWRRTRFVPEMNTSMLEMNVPNKTHLNLSHTHTASYMYQPLSNSYFQKDVKMIATYLQKRAVSQSHTHLQVCYTHKSYIHNSILCWTKRSSSRLSW